MAVSIALEFFTVAEFVTACTVPIYWNDITILEGDEEWNDTTVVDGIFDEPYSAIDLGIAGQDSAAPLVSFPTADVPGAIEGDDITINGTTYKVGVVKVDGTGVTECTLWLDS